MPEPESLPVVTFRDGAIPISVYGLRFTIVMIRPFALLVMVVTTACGAPEVRTEWIDPLSPAAESMTPIAIGCDDLLVGKSTHERPSDDPDYWLEALVFGASNVVDQENVDD